HSLPAGTDEPDLTEPQPTLGDIPELIAETRRSGVGVNVTMLVNDVSAAPPSLGVAAYRTVQEALTNVLRHA
ncbi:MAG: two-component sensor histidine kinase, partial [Actinobacteria bacterium]|nr:two-component sensor histidine kinase [Actinomycetota bacterium]